jgi:hypothetical protein
VLSVPLRTSPLDRFVGPPTRDPLSGPLLGASDRTPGTSALPRVPPDLHGVTSPDITLVPDPQPRSRLSCFPTSRFRFLPVGLRLQTPGVPDPSSAYLGPTDPDPSSVCFPDLLSVGIRLQSCSSPPSPSRESSSSFPLSDPQLRLQPFPRARPFSLSQQSMTATWRACSSGRLRVFLHVWRRTTARARTSLLS